MKHPPASPFGPPNVLFLPQPESGFVVSSLARWVYLLWDILPKLRTCMAAGRDSTFRFVDAAGAV